MKVGLCTDKRFLLHCPPGEHPERPERLIAIEDAFRRTGLVDRIAKVSARRATREELERVHTPTYLDSLMAILGEDRRGWLDPDTYYSPGSLEAALLGAGAAVELAEQVRNGTLDAGLLLARPPGHHATRHQAMGFCLLNQAATAAAALRNRGARVAIFDWDLHHGNGTEAIFYEDPHVLYCSMHEWPQYPGTGAEADIGHGRGVGATVNVPLPSGTDGATYLSAFRTRIAPALSTFSPEVLVVSAGFDAHREDPLGGLALSDETYGLLTEELYRIQPRLVFILEGGYHLGALARSTVQVVEVLLQLPSTSPSASGSK
jgi:acetoin utilization deacetylase AcuC-like enzyme